MRRVLVIGSGGSGKSTLAARIGTRMGLPVVHLDALYWRPGWVSTPAAEWAELVGAIAARDRWVMDGNYGGTLEARLRACDTVIFLDTPRLVCLWRVLARWARHRGRSRPDMGPNCPERLDGEFLQFLRWVWSYPSRQRPAILARLQEAAGEKRVFVLRSAADVERFVAGLTPQPA